MKNQQFFTKSGLKAVLCINSVIGGICAMVCESGKETFLKAGVFTPGIPDKLKRSNRKSRSGFKTDCSK